MNRYIMGMKAKAAIIFLTMLSSSEKIAPGYDGDWWDLRGYCIARDTRLPIFGKLKRDLKPFQERLKERIN